MPLLSIHGQAGDGAASPSTQWFETVPGRAVLDSEAALIHHALDERSGYPWCWLAPRAALPGTAVGPLPQVTGEFSRGLLLAADTVGWAGAVRCRLPLPLASDSIGTVVLQHVVRTDADGDALLAECARVLIPGGRLLLFALNPLSPYRWRWRGSGLGACEPLTWRRRLRAVGLSAEPVSQGLGPAWAPQSVPRLQNGPGLRVAYLLRADKRTFPLTPLRQARPLRLTLGAPAA